MIAQNYVMSLFNMVSDSNATAGESAKTRNSSNNSNSEFAQIMNMFSHQNSNRPYGVLERKNSVRAINNDTRKRFDTPQSEAAQKESFVRNEKERGILNRPENDCAVDDKAGMAVSNDGKKAPEAKRAGAADKNKEISAEKNIEDIAAIVGLDSAQLKMILNAAGININDLSDGANVSMISEKLAAFLGLDNQLKQELQQIIAAIIERNAGIGEFQSMLGMSVEEVKKGLNIQGSLEVERISGKVTDKLAEAIREKLSEISSSSEESQGEVKADENGETLIKKAESDLADNNYMELQKDINAYSPENNANDEYSQAQEESSELYIGAEVENAESIEVNALSDRDEQLITVSETGDNNAGVNIQPDAAFYNSNAEKAVNETLKPSVENVKSGNEIIRQVVDKAKVILDGDKSEMILSLKPESLGKLSLKVVTENGIVIAKFVAENDQVKQILEANMHLLKENLESQGLNVQSFSVSVRQDSGNEKGYYSDEKEGRRNLNVKIQNIPVAAANPSGFIQTETGSAYLNWGTSTINLTA
ncbi:MAG TPA: flagellar hook-length control protein FliK [Clostridiaceae bacterium]|nr:flagellar hook-length control protein FliK [Clostridiaceae bacterium]HHV99043.1 flagellar hook-length control protein FliK [Clostridiaceae bacterium]